MTDAYATALRAVLAAVKAVRFACEQCGSAADVAITEAQAAIDAAPAPPPDDSAVVESPIP